MVARVGVCMFFFFSSRRRHTRLQGDWSSDVCSSDLLHYVRPYWFQLLASVVSMALVGLFDAFRLLLIGPIFDHVLNPGTQPHELQLLPTTNWAMQLNWFVPDRFHNIWTMVAFALVAATVLKGVFDY